MHFAMQLLNIPGVIASGLLLGVASAAVVAAPDGPQLLELAHARAGLQTEA